MIPHRRSKYNSPPQNLYHLDTASVELPSRPVAPKEVSIVKDWRLWVGILAGVGAVAFYWHQDRITQRVLVITPYDQSGSALAFEDTIKDHCKAVIESLKQGDRLIITPYAASPDTISDTVIVNTIGLLDQCNHQLPPDSIGQYPGTAPDKSLNSVIIQLEAARAKGNGNPAIVSMFIHEAEPVPGALPFDSKAFAVQVKAITDNNGVVSIFGPRDSLLDDLESHLKDNPYADVWPMDNVTESVEWAFETARQLPPTLTEQAQ